jgi:bifunctional NMN adenylyltransferase/nudix hydrolase
MTKKYDLMVFIGRFQPYHNGHKKVIQYALEHAEHVLVLIGSSNCSPDIRNPFSFESRRWMIKNDNFDVNRIFVEPINDTPYSDSDWIKEIQEKVSKVTNHSIKPKICLVGHSKDHSSYYLKLFPEWDAQDVGAETFPNGEFLNATDIRKSFFHCTAYGDYAGNIDGLIPESTRIFLSGFIKTKEYKDIVEEWNHILKYRKGYSQCPYPPTFITVDAVVVQAGHVILVKRRDRPGKGKLALPGGFIQEYERIEDAVIRELKEETTIDIPVAVLKSKAVAQESFTYPYRSTRGRTITFATLFDLNSELDRKKFNNPPIGMTKIKGADDAETANWYPLSSLTKENLFEDHYDIIMKMLEHLK